MASDCEASAKKIHLSLASVELERFKPRATIEEQAGQGSTKIITIKEYFK